jgi:hypothetical protein
MKGQMNEEERDRQIWGWAIVNKPGNTYKIISTNDREGWRLTREVDVVLWRSGI